MTIQVTCDSCFCTFGAKNEHAGKKGKCPECGEPVIVPSGNSAAPPRASSRAPAARGTSRSASPPKSNNMLVIGGIAAGSVIVLLIGVIAFLMGRSGRNEAAPAVVQNTPAGGPAPAANSTAPTSNAVTVTTPPATSPSSASLTPTTTTTAPPSVPPGAASPAGNTTPPAAGGGTSSAPAGGETKEYTNTADLVAAVEPSACRLSVRLGDGRTSTGSGFVIDQEGTIVTNYHVMEEGVSATVVFPDRSQGQVVGVLASDWKMDLAILKIDYPREKLKPVKLATEDPRKGEVIVAIGAPLGLDFSMSEGKVSGIRDAATLQNYGGEFQGKWIQSSAPISPGNSGGPMFNMRGEVVGANTLSLAVEGAQNLNFGTSADNIRSVLARRTANPQALSAKLLPAANGRSSQSGGRPDQVELVDETKSERGKKLLSEIKEILLFDINISFDSSGKITEYVSNSAEKMWKSAGVELTRRRDAQALMIVLMRFKQAGSSATAKTLEVTTAIIMVDRSGPKPRQVKVWEAEDDLGSVSEASLVKGVIPERMRSKVQEFFGKIRTAYKQGGTAAKPDEKP